LAQQLGPAGAARTGGKLGAEKTDGAIPIILLWFIRFINAVIIVLL
jgi:hypothetical protein